MDAPFLGFPDTQAFLRDLRANNDRDWFNAHKATYERVYKAPAEAFVAELRPRLEALAGVTLGGKVFRIHRDVRFSKDKSPYNTHLHIGFQHQRSGGEPRRRHAGARGRARRSSRRPPSNARCSRRSGRSPRP